MRKNILILTGLLIGAQVAFSAPANNLVINGSFESGDFSGWTLAGTDVLPGGNDNYYGVDSVDAHTGAYGAYFGPVGGVLNLSQTIATIPGASYEVSFWLA